MNEFMKFIGTMAVAVASVIFGGYVLAILWGWFIVPTFGLPALGIAQALGVSLVVRYTTHQIPTTKDERSLGTLMAFAVGKPLAFLGMGWIVLQYI